MAIKLSEEERKALIEKSENPEKPVRCPRCGKLLQYREVASSYEVKCENADCIKMAVRGI